jgi:ribosomal protein S6
MSKQKAAEPETLKSLSGLKKLQAARKELDDKASTLSGQALADFGRFVAVNFDCKSKSMPDLDQVAQMVEDLVAYGIVKNKTVKTSSDA